MGLLLLSADAEQAIAVAARALVLATLVARLHYTINMPDEL